MQLDDYHRTLKMGNKALEMRRGLLGESYLDTTQWFILKWPCVNPRTADHGMVLVEVS